MPAGEDGGVQRASIDVAASTGGWPDPWPNVAEIASVLPPDRWTLIGGLMTQLHCIHHGLGVVRPTNDVDIVLHVETTRGVASETAAALRSLGYELRPAVDPRHNTAHRFVRDNTAIDLVSSRQGEDSEEVVDVLLSDHHAPRVTERLAGREMIRIEGGTQALRRTVNARMEIEPGTITTVSVPSVFGALILKAAAYTADSRDPERHLRDAVSLLACLDDPFAERDTFAGSDRSRLLRLRAHLDASSAAWTVVTGRHRIDAETALEILTEEA
ncbi:hypothetical protein [Aeromicrobium erythreum]|uniref:Uncharacterized protein n=1 Tax=Aeromicrobium erythreum TaxID=2041 RepID=A0A0U4CJN9_9ACTN|nr:hypothetical protein [Aeromicrobium erythreum]ALX05557.1 hypothetical protein AERYTH_13040 [Aeromicrobium erythreum]